MSYTAIERAIAAARDLQRVGQLQQAEAICHKIITAQPGCGEALSLLGLICHQSGRQDEAIELFRRATDACPQSADLFCNLGVVLHRAPGRLDEAIVAYRHALVLAPGRVEILNNLGLALFEKGSLEEAIATYRRVLAQKPDYSAAHYNLGLALLMQGDLEHGWPEHEWRLKVNEMDICRPTFAQPQWQGEELRGKKIFVYDEQGAGDAIQFARYLSYLSDQGGKVILGCHPSLLRLMKSVRGVTKCVVSVDEEKDFDVHCSLMSLPSAFKTSLETIPSATPYVRAERELAEQWRERVASADSPPARLKVGVSWAGRPQHPNDHNRSLPFRLLAPLGQSPGARFFSLQKGDAAREAADSSVDLKLIDFSHDLNDFADTAALIDNLDLVITIDSSVAHLAGAMGKTVWVLLPFTADWRWLQNRADSPWYPTMKLYRQSQPGDWQTPIAHLAESLKSLNASLVRSSGTPE